MLTRHAILEVRDTRLALRTHRRLEIARRSATTEPPIARCPDVRRIDTRKPICARQLAPRRREGIGRGLLAQVEAHGRAVGATRVWLETSTGERAGDRRVCPARLHAGA